LDLKVARKSDEKTNLKLIKDFDETLKHVKQTLANWNWFATKYGEGTLITARVIVPEEIEGAVVLAATAGSNVVYQLFDQKADVIPVPTLRQRDPARLHRPCRGQGNHDREGEG